ncbi:hypothetical protein DICPUDRAFT_74931 [Dictyostelium purpureum]|uniref:RRM Nup35-type domain-containing protein n=1 Tax=Dictyostelium purpureum TaxID=5786 RepID=F0Z958_DICPU|nr:uncharacterized protein DICPUDRAFT_74931 [Dictyostelium purpureum]EGC39522.1 hypothetical protein DICPUDRAFT_74931 [Dictyostelium purpureum]|eukprot:XP_003283969.1 hypothetical protein DICPUDRAFT_74931 [Dictyostelium purpureum]
MDYLDLFCIFMAFLGFSLGFFGIKFLNKNKNKNINNNNININNNINNNNAFPQQNSPNRYTAPLTQQQQQQQQQQQHQHQHQHCQNPQPKIHYISSSSLSQMFSEHYDRRWVTIFGFPQEKIELVVDELSKFGNILEMKYPHQTNANWVYLKFDSEATASYILNLGSLSFNKFMLGFVPYKDKL